jgi:hypothetical protein
LVSIEAARSALSSRRVTIATNGESEALDAHFDNIREANTAKECFDIAPEAPLHEVLRIVFFNSAFLRRLSDDNSRYFSFV